MRVGNFVFCAALLVCTIGVEGKRAIYKWNFCEKESACAGACTEVFSGLGTTRWPRKMTGACRVDTQGRPYCRCEYEGVLVPCGLGADARCPPSSIIDETNVCNATRRDEACTLGCRFSYYRLAPFPPRLEGRCEDSWSQPNVRDIEGPVLTTNCICYRKGNRLN